MSFGFAVGDFLATINFVHELAVALNDGCGSGARFRGLVQELYSLERAMIAINDLHVPANLESHLWMVQPAASQCRRAITDFLQKSDVYMQCLGQGGSTKWWKDVFYKIKWAVYKADDVEELRACLRGHSAAMSIMLQVLQIQSVKETVAQMGNQAQSQAVVDQSQMQQLVASMQANLMQEISKATLEVTTNQTESSAGLHTTMVQTLQMTMQIYQTMLQAQAEVPSQVMRQQPVYLEDAYGVVAPFHLEFVTCADVLIHALKERYSESGALRVEQGRFAITDARTNRDIDLSREWKRCFRPGQRVNMSLFFDDISRSTTCPSCRRECIGDLDSEVECSNCGLIFRKIEILDQPETSNPSLRRNDSSRGARGRQKSEGNSNTAQKAGHGPNNDPEDPSDTSYDDDLDDESDDSDEISQYKRIRLFKQGGIHWDSLSCHKDLRISRNGLGVSCPDPPTPLRPNASTYYSSVMATRPMRCAATGEGITAWFDIRILQGEVCVGFCTESARDQLLLGAKPTAGIYVRCCNDRRISVGGLPGNPRLGESPKVAPGDVVIVGLSDQFSFLLVNGRVIDFIEFDEQHRQLPMYPIVGLRGGAKIVANFNAGTLVATPKSLEEFYIWALSGA